MVLENVNDQVAVPFLEQLFERHRQSPSHVIYNVTVFSQAERLEADVSWPGYVEP